MPMADRVTRQPTPPRARSTSGNYESRALTPSRQCDTVQPPRPVNRPVAGSRRPGAAQTRVYDRSCGTRRVGQSGRRGFAQSPRAPRRASFRVDGGAARKRAVHIQSHLRPIVVARGHCISDAHASQGSPPSP
jgi:hypothetical protein